MEESDVARASLALMDAADDSDPAVREQVRKSLLALGKRRTAKILSMCQDYLIQHSKLEVGHRVVLLQTIELVVKSKIGEISYPKIKSLIHLASEEMTRSKEIVPDWQQAASNILVAVGDRYIKDVMEEVLSKFQPGHPPHFFVVQTLANLSYSNVYGTVPFLGSILTAMLPMLGMTRQDNMKWVFSSALHHFSESIVDYLANMDKAPDPAVRKDAYSAEIYAACDILFCNWLQSKETKLKLTVTSALGSMSLLLAQDKLEELLPKLIPAVLSLYKKNSEHYIISKSLCQILEASMRTDSRFLETQIDGIMFTLYHQVCMSVDCRNPSTLKNHNEVLRCFTFLANTFSERVIPFVIQKLEVRSERNRLGTLAVLKHLINTSSSVMESKKLLILNSVRQPMLDRSNKVKKMFVQVVSAMAHHGYLELEGGDLLVRFIILHCALPDTSQHGCRPPDQEDVTNEALRNMCANMLHLFTTTVDRLTDVLWPSLFCYLTQAQYTDASTPLCKSLILLADKKKAVLEPGSIVDFSAQDNLPSPYVVMVRLLVNASFPFRCQGRGAPSLGLMRVLSSSIHPKLECVWQAEIPPLLHCLEESTEETLDRRRWEGRLLELLSKTLVAVSYDKWICQLATEATRYLPTYNSYQEEKSFLYKCIGVTLQHCNNKEAVRRQLQELLGSVRHHSAVEREGAAVGVGLCASSHLDDTLAKLEDFRKSDIFKKASGIFGLLKDRGDADLEKAKSTLILCYGYVALLAPEDQILCRIDSEVLWNIGRLFNTKVLGVTVETKDLTMKLSLIQSVGLIAQAVSACVRRQGYLFTRKQELMGVIMDFVKAEPLDVLRNPVRHLAMTTCANLFNLEPALTEKEKSDMLRTCLNSTFGLPPTELPDRGKDGQALDPRKREALYTDTFSALQSLLKTVLMQDLNPDGLQRIFKHLKVWLCSEMSHERERAMRTAAEMLAFYLNHLNIKKMGAFHNLGALLGELIPRCTDPSPPVRLAAMDCIQALLYVQLGYEGFDSDHKDEAVEKLGTLSEKLTSSDMTLLYRTCSELTKIISRHVPQQQLPALVFTLLDGLADPQTDCACSSSMVLHVLLKSRGASLQDRVPEVLEAMRIRSPAVSEEQVRTVVAQTLLVLAAQHLQTVVNVLISFPLPLDSWCCEIWFSLGAEGTLTFQIMEMILEKLNVMVPFVDKKDSVVRPSTVRVATGPPLAMTCALHEMMLNGRSQEAVAGLFPRLFGALVVRLGSSVGVLPPRDAPSASAAPERSAPAQPPAAIDVCGVAVEALRVLLVRAQLEKMLRALKLVGAWEKIRDLQQHTEGVTLLARHMAKHAGQHLPAIVDNLHPNLSNIYECQRITVTAFFSELLNHRGVTELQLMEALMSHMTERLADPCCAVRVLAMRGLGNIATGSPEKVNMYAKQLLAAMSSGLEDKDDPSRHIALEAMSGLSKVLLCLDQKNVQILVVYIFMKIKPFLENENERVRCSSMLLLGTLSKFACGEPVFRDQIHNVLVSLLLHLSDPSPQVVKASKFAMRVCAPVLGSEIVTAMFQNHLHDDRGLHHGEFINDLTKYIIRDFPSMLNFYHISIVQFFESPWPEVRASAAMFIGFLLVNLPEEHLSDMNMGSVIKGLVHLLQDPDPLVRAKAAEAMGHFHHF
ncbi:maestro heat-like repeat-containing protein family member 1 [Anguilla anguilla]|uniref:maestro heat-like repeat-containing protein family member 1 n=1 Tax=Anguilla anguilla TaxID=7936 RepID=UPI0015ACCF1A|nr:maestro heat-like repeat-containing protein family member 1 [Anguilla anguilla]